MWLEDTAPRRAVMQPTVLLNAIPKMHVIPQVNDATYGLAAWLFTSNVNTALMSARRLEVGIVSVKDTSSSRVDLMPYGGVKDSGFGHEGPKYAIRG